MTEADIFTVEARRTSQKKTKKPSFFQEGTLMGGKLSITVIIFGCALILLGLSFLPAAFSHDHDQTILGAAICAVSFGALLISLGVYLKARFLNFSAAGNGKPQSKTVRGGCELCGTESPVIHCRVHQLHICSECVGQHYDFRSCVYIPSTRRPGATKPLAKAARAAKA
ncbi:MAG TPA: hypothetical protein VGL74_10885 [Terriglobales bacterium]